MSNPIRKILIGTATLALMISLYFSAPWNPLPIPNRDSSTNEELAKSYEKVLVHAKDEDVVLAEMILTLIQNYYVDANQFDFEKLMLSTLKNLKNHGDLSYEVDKNSIRLKDGHLEREIPRKWSEDELGRVSSIFKVAQFLEDTHKMIDKQDSVAATLSAFVASLDPYSKLLSDEDYRELKEGTDGEFGGLGIMVGVRNDLLTVIKLLPHSPADRAGIHPQDHILAVNGQTTFGASLDDLVKVMRGLPGSPATLSFLRDNGKSPFDISMKRELVQIDPVSIQHLKTPKNNEAILLKLDTFSMKSYDRLHLEIEKSLASRKTAPDGIIIDLRSNPGGLLEQAVKISKILLAEGSIVTVKGHDTETEYADHQNLNIPCPVVVLIDEDSASASEILAGALKDHDRAIIIGQPSYGKGTVQTVFELPTGRALKLTIARYLTPSGASIQGVGVIPDIWLHPIFKQDLNENMMGHYRYRLDSPFIGYNPTKQVHLGGSNLISAYYLKDPERDLTIKQSKEVDLALTMFDEYKKSPDKKKGDANFHSSIFLNKIRGRIQSMIRSWDSEASAYLKAKQINWFNEPLHSNVNSIHIVEKSVEAPKKILPGTNISIPFTLKNESSSGISRSSVFLRSVHREMDTVEKLIGYLKPQGTFKDHFVLAIPSSWLSGKVQFQIGVAMDGVELENTIQELAIDIVDRKESVLSVNSKSSDVLMTGKTVGLVVSIKNEGDEDIHIDRVKILNLSGRQVSVKERGSYSPREVKAHDQVDVSVDLTGTKEIFSDQLSLGVSVESHELKSPLYKLINIAAVPSVPHDKFTEHEK